MKPFCFTIENDDGGEIEHRLPSKWELCDACRGDGARDNPAFGNGLTSEDFEDQDFREEYMRGGYDVSCDECSGTGKVLVVDETNLTDPQKVAYGQYLDRASEDARERRADAYTRRMENGGRE